MSARFPSSDDYTDASADEVLGWSATREAPPEAPGAKKRAAAAMLALCTFMGLLLALTTAPLSGAGAITVREGTEYWEDLPAVLPDQPLPRRSVILAADGSRIGEFYSENRVLVPLSQVPEHVQDALLAIEDARYYDHHGVDLRGTVRAAANNVLTDSVQGGSTITQQYVKQVLFNAATDEAERDEVTSQSSYLRKLREARLATALEDRLTKQQILEGYLNIAYFGDGAYGIGAAARHYFGVGVSELTVEQGALLAGIVRNPSAYDPTDNPDEAVTRRNVVLTRMNELGDLDDAELQTALEAPLRLDVTEPDNGCTDARYPFFCQWVYQQLQDDPAFGKTPAARERLLYQGGLTVRTSLDPKAQRLAQRSVDDALGRDNRVAAASVTVEPGTGEVVAMATNRTFGQNARRNQTEVLLPVVPAFQPGSNMKPFTLAAALEEGYDLSTVYNAPAAYAPSGFNYPPGGFKNSGSAASGPLTAAQAVWRSSNTFFVHLETQVGVLDVADMAERLGITSLPRTGERAIGPADAALTLGVYEVSPLELAGAYATFAASGVHCIPHGIVSVTVNDDEALPVPDPECRQAIPAGVADTMASIMQGTIDGPDPARTAAALSLGRPAGGKTGTTQNNAAVWFSGFTPQYATSVWVGDPRGGFAYPLQNFTAYGQFVSRAYGSTVAGPIWQRIMLGIHEGLPVKQFAPPDANTGDGYAETMPDVRGLTPERALAVLQDAQFDVAVARRTAEPNRLLVPGRVASTRPAAGASVALHERVVLTLTDGSRTQWRVKNPDWTIEPEGEVPGGEPVGPAPGTNADRGGGVVSNRR
ncbi:transglycosylase domain-containing protein [Nocardioidaceae bacterium]|nr:transglycosylase domain-containing protein [Nocardioidaceae bacterium]